MVNAVAFLLAAKLFARCFRLPRRWFGCNLVLADNFPREDDEDEEPARWFWWKVADVFAKEEHDMFTMLVFLVCNTIQNEAEKCGYLLSHKVGFGCFCFASSGAVSSFGFPRSSRSLIGGGKEAGKAPPSRNKENRGAEAKEIYFLRDFPLNLKGNFSASKERNKHFRHYRTQHHHRAHNIIYKNGIRDEVTNQRRFQKSRTGEENGHSGEEGTCSHSHRSRGVG